MEKNGRYEIAAGIAAGVFVGLIGLGLANANLFSGIFGSTPQARQAADFANDKPSAEARQVADWIARSNNNLATDFLIVDKKHTHIYVFDSSARLRAATPVLIGAAPGDHTVEGIGAKPLTQIRPEERTTPAGRFVAERGHNARGEDVVWVDYDSAVSIHRVLTTDPKERRLERLASPGIDDNRVSYGCINVPVEFYETHIRPIFVKKRAIVYVLPEEKGVEEVFGLKTGTKPGLQAKST